MSRDYAESRIREALRLSKGNTTRARQQVIAWAAEDQRLLLGLTQPHLTGVVAHAINRVLSRTNMETGDIAMEPESLNMPPDTFGRQILNALSSTDTPVFGLESGGLPSGQRKKASQSHIDAIKQMASKKSTGDRK